MSRSRESLPMAGLPSLLGFMVLVELVLLRTGTRTLIHIPGLGRFETPIGILAEVGRLAYYLAVVFVVATLAALAHHGLRAKTRRQMVGGAGALVMLVASGVGRLGVLPAHVVGWTSLAVLVAVTASAWQGRRSLPVGLFVLGSVAAGWAVLGQEGGGSLSGRQVDSLVISAEIFLVLAAITAPLLVQARPGKLAVLAGIGVTVLTAGALTAGSSTVSILVLWNLGVPGWLPGIGYAVALGSLATTLWSALESGDRLTAIGLVLLVGGGVGVISTYQTGLVLTAVLLMAYSVSGEPLDLAAGSVPQTYFSTTGRDAVASADGRVPLPSLDRG